MASDTSSVMADNALRQQERATIAAVIICKNEERIIRHALKSIASWVHEIVVVDSESTDNTVAICREFTTQVYVRPWAGFSAQRNFALAQVSSDWVFILDADEVVPAALAQEIQEAVVTTQKALHAGQGNSAPDAPPTAFRIPRRSWFCGRFLQWGGNYPDYVLRLLRRGSGEYGERFVHETLAVSGTIGYLREPLLHYTYPTLELYFKKFDHYSQLSALQMQRDGKKWRAGAMLFRPGVTFFLRYIVKRGYRDGWQGFLYAALAGFQVFAKYARLWELEHRAEHESQLNASLAAADAPRKDAPRADVPSKS
ncbi:MAG: glycosyltransferase family 2 protein [Abitibacteriaceae bacterium]|nr:glycosyltransferase family 2 protein [Abditibacteriaceae bacterium]